jgi:hypothetical protein
MVSSPQLPPKAEFAWWYEYYFATQNGLAGYGRYTHDANGAPHAPASAYREKFSGKYEHRELTGGVGHNLPQEAPRAFAQSVVDVDNFS